MKNGRVILNLAHGGARVAMRALCVTLGDSALGDMGTFFGLGAAEFEALSSAALEYYEVNSDTSEEE